MHSLTQLPNHKLVKYLFLRKMISNYGQFSTMGIKRSSGKAHFPAGYHSVHSYTQYVGKGYLCCWSSPHRTTFTSIDYIRWLWSSDAKLDLMTGLYSHKTQLRLHLEVKLKFYYTCMYLSFTAYWI